MSVLPRFVAAAVEPAAIARWEQWIPVAIVIVFVLIAGWTLAVLNHQYRSGWVASHEISMDKAGAIHKLLFREE